MKTSLTAASISGIRADLTRANQSFARAYPGASHERQPVHSVYGGAQLFTYDTALHLSRTALRTVDEYLPDAEALRGALEIPDNEANRALWRRVHERMVAKLRREAVEDFRIDFEDGYGTRPDPEEDGHAASTALEVARGMREATLPPFIGIRIKPFTEECVTRSVRTLDIFLSTLLGATGSRLPSGFVVTLPKVTVAEQSRALSRLLALIEEKNGLGRGTIRVEIMVETPQSILGPEGTAPIRTLVEAAEGRCVGAHFGTYDYTAGCSITASHQSMSNPVCDFAKHVLQVSLAGTPVFLSDGATNIMPVGPHHAPEGTALTEAQSRENRAVVHRAMRIGYGHIRHSLETGYYQGWDLHPAQLPVRYAALYAFFLESFEPAAARLKAFVEKAAKATLLGDVFDDAATGQGLLNYFLRGMACGAVTEAEALATGVTLEEFRGRSFVKILKRGVDPV